MAGEEEFTGLPESTAPEAKPFIQELWNGPQRTQTLFSPQQGGGWQSTDLSAYDPMSQAQGPRLGPMYGQIAQQQGQGGLGVNEQKELQRINETVRGGFQLSPADQRKKQVLEYRQQLHQGQQQPSQVLGGLGGGIQPISPMADPNFVPDRNTQHQIGQLESDVAQLLSDPTLEPTAPGDNRRAVAIAGKQQQMDNLDPQRQYRKNSPFMRQRPSDKAMRDFIINRNEYGEPAKAGERVHSTILLDANGQPKSIHEFKKEEAKQTYPEGQGIGETWEHPDTGDLMTRDKSGTPRILKDVGKAKMEARKQVAAEWKDIHASSLTEAQHAAGVDEKGKANPIDQKALDQRIMDRISTRGLPKDDSEFESWYFKKQHGGLPKDSPWSSVGEQAAKAGDRKGYAAIKSLAELDQIPKESRSPEDQRKIDKAISEARKYLPGNQQAAPVASRGFKESPQSPPAPPSQANQPPPRSNLMGASTPEQARGAMQQPQSAPAVAQAFPSLQSHEPMTLETTLKAPQQAPPEQARKGGFQQWGEMMGRGLNRLGVTTGAMSGETGDPAEVRARWMKKYGYVPAEVEHNLRRRTLESLR